jgi:hypothetical protein
MSLPIALLLTLLLPTSGPSTRPSTTPATTRPSTTPATTRPSTTPATTRASFPSAASWTNVRIDARALADHFEFSDFAYSVQTVREPDGSTVQRDVLLFQARAKRGVTIAVLQARMLDDSGEEIDRSVVRFKPIVLHWAQDQSATASCWIDPGIMPRVRTIELLPL